MTSMKPPSAHATMSYTPSDLRGGGSPAEGDGLAGSPHRAGLGSAAAPELPDLGLGNRVELMELARAVERGQLSMAQAVDRLVEGTVGAVPGQLTALERAELSAILKQALQLDPTLRALSQPR